MAKETIKWRRFPELSDKELSKLCNTVENQITEAFVIPPALLGSAGNLTASEVKARLRHYGDIKIPDGMCGGMCEPRRVRRVDSRVIEPKQLLNG